jgi:hypothetical protein
MLRPFSCLPRAASVAFVVRVVCRVGFGQSAPPQATIKKDVNFFQKEVNEAVSTSSWGFFQNAKGAYLEGYGIVVVADIAFDPPANPFNIQRTPEEIRTTTAQRRKDVEEKLTNLLKQKAGSLESVGPSESVAIVLNIMNTNPAYVTDIPYQIVLSVKKQDAARVNLKEYK